MKPRPDYEQRFEIALRRILSYMTPDQLRRQAEKQYGLAYEEALEMAYENVQSEARSALMGFRRKRRSVKPPVVGAVDPNVGIQES